MLRKLCLFAGLALPLSAAELTGVWIGQIPARNGDPLDVAFKFTQKPGGSLSGKVYGDYQSSPIVEGSVTGDQVMFVVVAQEQAGNQINDTKLKYTGVLKDGALELTRERQESKNAGNGGGVQFKGDSKQTLTVKRLTR